MGKTIPPWGPGQPIRNPTTKLPHTNSASTGSDASSERPPLLEPLRQNGDTGQEQASTSCPYHDALRKKQLPVPGAKPRHHRAKADQNRSGDDKEVKMPAVVQRAGEDAEPDEQEGLDRSDPGDAAARLLILKQRPLVKRLEGTCSNTHFFRLRVRAGTLGIDGPKELVMPNEFSSRQKELRHWSQATVPPSGMELVASRASSCSAVFGWWRNRDMLATVVFGSDFGGWGVIEDLKSLYLMTECHGVD